MTSNEQPDKIVDTVSGSTGEEKKKEIISLLEKINEYFNC